MTGIYKITSPAGKVYIGKSTRIENRFRCYRKMVKHTIGRMLFHSLQKHTPDNHAFDIIHELPKDINEDVLSVYEQLYIEQYRACGYQLLNLTDGGEGSTGYKHTQQSLIKMSIKGKGRFSGSQNPNYGKGCFGEKNGIYGQSRPHLIKKMVEANEKTVYQYSKSNELIKVHRSAASAARELNLKISNISACCLKKKGYNTAGGFIWTHAMLRREKSIYYPENY